jgi:hypothetical protein
MLLPVILLACSTPHPLPSERFQPALERLLVIRDTSDEAQAVTWQAASELDLARLDQALVRRRESGPMCLKLNELHALEFTAMDDAIDWLKRHRQQLLVGTLVIAAGVTFIVISAGAGILVLAPLVLVSQSGSALDGQVCEG